jgi:hypothetical protein
MVVTFALLMLPMLMLLTKNKQIQKAARIVGYCQTVIISLWLIVTYSSLLNIVLSMVSR